MRRISSLMFFLMSAVVVFTSCGEDPVPNGLVTISGIPATATIEVGGTVGPVTATVSAPDGLASFVIKKDGATIITVPFAGETSASQEFSYTATAADAGKNLVFEFIATDRNGDAATVTHVLTVGAEATTVRVTGNITGSVNSSAHKK